MRAFPVVSCGRAGYVAALKKFASGEKDVLYRANDKGFPESSWSGEIKPIESFVEKIVNEFRFVDINQIIPGKLRNFGVADPQGIIPFQAVVCHPRTALL
jgi:hypothetical protein